MPTTTLDPRAIVRPKSLLKTTDLWKSYLALRNYAISVEGSDRRHAAQSMQDMRAEFCRRGFAVPMVDGKPALVAKRDLR